MHGQNDIKNASLFAIGQSLMTLYLEPVYLHCRIPDSIGGIFLTIQNLYSIHIRYELCQVWLLSVNN